MSNSIDILLIEDNRPDADFLKELLSGDREYTFSVMHAQRLSDGISLLNKQPFDLALLDLGLPDSQGIGTALTFRKHAPRLPIIVLTGLNDEDTALKALQMDIQDYFVKGQINRNLLVRSIRYAIERKRSVIALQESEARFRAFFELASVGAVQLDSASGRFSRVNERFCRITGYRPEELLTMTIADITHPDDRAQDQEHASQVVRGELDQYDWEKRYIHKEGHIIWVSISATVIRDIQGRPIRTIGIVQDITQRKKMEDEIKHMAHHDPLTGLPNRRLFIDLLNSEIAQAQRNRKRIAILFMDLDHFKTVNDTLGHEIGDLLLIQAAQRFRGAVRKSDLVARIGGDEFNILLTDFPRVEYVSDVSRKLLDCFKKPFMISGHELHITTSIGISIYPDDAEDFDTLLRYADISMYHAKDIGRNCYQFFNAELNLRIMERAKLEKMLRRAIQLGELELYYQPQIDVNTNQIVCAEALVRWNHPERGLLEPAQFIPLAEETGFITEIDAWALKTACTQGRTWMDANLPALCLTVNLSARQFQKPNMIDYVAGILEQTGLPADRLDIEITESVAMINVEHTISRLNELNKMGVSTSLDDFGTGYSSLSYLKRLPIQKLKIDKSFIQGLATEHDDRTIISAVLLMAKTMKLRVAAEGVEQTDQLSFLQSMKCDEVQGYLFSRPVPEHKFRVLMAAGR